MAAVTSRGIGRDAVVGDPVVAGQDHRPDPVHRTRRADPLAGGQPGGQILQPAQRAERLGQGVETLDAAARRRGRGRGDHAQRGQSGQCRRLGAPRPARRTSRCTSSASTTPRTAHKASWVTKLAVRNSYSTVAGKSAGTSS